MKVVQRFPVSFFILAAVVITYGLGIATFLALRKVQAGFGIELSWAGELVLKFGPSLAGVLTIALTLGRSGVGDLLRRCFRWRAPVALYLIAMFLHPVILLLVLVIRGHAAELQSVTTGAAMGVFAAQLFLTVFLGGGLGEELGWRGFMLPRLMIRHSPLIASLLVAVAWFAWHVPGYILFNKAASDPILPFAVIMFPFSILLTWLCLRSNLGLVLPILLHGSVNASYYSMAALLPAVTGADGFQPAFDWWVAGIWCVIAVVVVAKWGPTLTPRLDLSARPVKTTEQSL